MLIANTVNKKAINLNTIEKTIINLHLQIQSNPFMKKIRVLKICFEQEIPSCEIPRFRGAIIEKTGRDKILFHNHIGDTKLRYAYPLIQYKVIGGKGCLICIDEGTNEIHSFLGQRNWDIELGDQKLTLTIDSLTANNFNLNVWDTQFIYSIRNWLAFNEENFKKYIEIDSLAEKITLLERVLVGNILSFAKGIGYTVEKNIELRIKDIQREKYRKYKGNKLLALDLTFSTNFFLPDYIGLGKGVSVGFGTVTQSK